MKERPIIFNDAMVRAILEGRKTQTRRIVKPQPVVPAGASIKLYDETALHMTGRRSWQVERPASYDGQGVIGHRDGSGKQVNLGRMPFCAGDRLWVRECWSEMFTDGVGEHLVYRADGEQDKQWLSYGRWKPSIHMPRWASRITLEITAVRVERLQDISEEDAKAEGVQMECDEEGRRCWVDYMWPGTRITLSAADSFASLWQSIYGVESWQSNPWVWVVEFRRLPP